MGKVIEFPKKKEFDESIYFEYLQLTEKIKKKEFDILLSEGYNEYNQEAGDLETYQRNELSINQEREEVRELKEKLKHMQERYIFCKDVIY